MSFVKTSKKKRLIVKI